MNTLNKRFFLSACCLLCGCTSTLRYIFSDSIWLPDGRLYPKFPEFSDIPNYPDTTPDDRIYYRMYTNMLGITIHEGFILWKTGHAAHIMSTNKTDVLSVNFNRQMTMGFYGANFDTQQFLTQFSGGSISTFDFGIISIDSLKIEKEKVVYSSSYQQTFSRTPPEIYDRVYSPYSLPIPDWTRTGISTDDN